jgi:hypothetical protein
MLDRAVHILHLLDDSESRGLRGSLTLSGSPV